jgi:chromosome segregation ATPase
LEKCRIALDEYEESNDLEMENLKHELNRHEDNQNHYKTIAQEYKNERDEVRQKLRSITEKLNDRNASIVTIEKEVQRVKAHFEEKENVLIKQHSLDIDELNKKYEKDRQQSSFFMAEKDALLQKLRELNMQNSKLSSVKLGIEGELKQAKIELEKERVKSNDRLLKLKKLINE